METDNASITEHACETAKDFVDLLRPERWDDFGHAWIFRGQRSADWGLVPSALRPDKAARLARIVPKGNYDAPQWIEMHTLAAFVAGLDRQGILLPGERAEVREQLTRSFFLSQHKPKIDELNDHRLATWPSSELFQVMALAQHYGVPTRLLDWSKRSFVAAYFASFDAAVELHRLRTEGEPVDAEPGDARLAVWAFDWYASQREEVRVDPDGPGERVVLVRVPSGLNSNLAAQEGMFTLSRVMTVGGAGLERLLDSRFFQRITLPWKHAGAALHLLRKYRVDANAVYPGVGGAAQAALESSLYPPRPRTARRAPHGG